MFCKIFHFSYEDCDHQIVDIPYFDAEETCEEVEFDECREVKHHKYFFQRSKYF